MAEGLDVGGVTALLERGDRAAAATALRDAGVREGDVGPALETLEACRVAADDLRAGRVVELVPRARAAAAGAPSIPEIRFRAASLLQAAFRFTGDGTLLGEAVGALTRLSDDVAHPRVAVLARGLLGNVHMLEGAYHAAVDRCEAGIALAAATGLAQTDAPAMAHQFRGYVLLEWNRLADAEDALTTAWRLAGERGAGVRSGVARIMARIAAERGLRAEAQAWLDRLEEIVHEPMTLRNREWLTAVRIGHVRGTGNVRAVEAWLGTYDYRPGAFAALGDAELAARLHEVDQVLAILEGMERWPEARDSAEALARGAGEHRRWFAARAHGTRAVALEALGQVDAADDAWARALEVGAAGSFVRVYLAGSALRARLLERASERPSTRADAVRVLAAAADEPGSGASDGVLTARQRDVLHLVARGDSNKAIARELGLSVSTVKTHLRSIFDTLGTASRTGAVARARERGWV